MDWNRVEGNWKQVKGKVKEKWGNLTDDDLTAINGQRDQLEGKIQQRYGLAKDQVRQDVDDCTTPRVGKAPCSFCKGQMAPLRRGHFFGRPRPYAASPRPGRRNNTSYGCVNCARTTTIVGGSDE